MAKKKNDFTVNDFVDDVWKVMEDQVEQNKMLKMVHAKLTPEWDDITGLIIKMLEAKEETETISLITEIGAYGETAVWPLIDTLLKMKEAMISCKKEEK